jgi:hypothetical protein
MSSAALELQKAVFSALQASSALAAALGGTARIHDHAPASVAFPYLTFGRLETGDWSTATEEGGEHVFTIHAWSKARGKAQVLAIMQAARGVLHDAALNLDGHHLVNLRLEFEDVRFDDDIAVYHGLMRFRAVTEPDD